MQREIPFPRDHVDGIRRLIVTESLPDLSYAPRVSAEPLLQLANVDRGLAYESTPANPGEYLALQQAFLHLQRRRYRISLRNWHDRLALGMAWPGSAKFGQRMNAATCRFEGQQRWITTLPER
jgi:hypothetical protein